MKYDLLVQVLAKFKRTVWVGENIVPGLEVYGKLHSPHKTGALLSWLALRHKRGRKTFVFGSICSVNDCKRKLWFQVIQIRITLLPYPHPTFL